MTSSPTVESSTRPGPMRLGVIGAGGFAGFICDALSPLPQVRVTAVADQDVDRAEALASRWSASAMDVPTLLASPDLDGVVIATPPAQHAALSAAALEAGKHVFCEKPAALTLDEMTQVSNLARRTGLVYAVDHVIHHNPLVGLLDQLRRRGVLGAVQRFVFENDAGDSDLGPDHWFWDPGHSGGIFLEHGVHFFDVARLLVGQPELAVQAMQHARPDGRVDTVVATVRHANGALATHSHGFSHANPTERQLMRVDFGLAEARLEGWIPLELRLDAWVDAPGLEVLEAVADDPASWLSVPGFEPGPRQSAHLEVARDAAPDGLRTHDTDHATPHRAILTVVLGEAADKQEVYTNSVRAAIVDFAHCARTGGQPRAGLAEAAATVAVASAATRALSSGATESV